MHGTAGSSLQEVFPARRRPEYLQQENCTEFSIIFGCLIDPSMRRLHHLVITHRASNDEFCTSGSDERINLRAWVGGLPV